MVDKEKDLPFRFGTFYIWCLFILFPIYIYLATQEISIVESIIDIILSTLFIAQGVGLYKRKYWGLVIVFVEIVFVAMLYVYYYFTYSYVLAIAFLFTNYFIQLMIHLIISIPILIYFYKRRFMFK